MNGQISGGMSFNVAKCKVLHVGHNNPKYDYLMNGTKLLEVSEEKDFKESKFGCCQKCKLFVRNNFTCIPFQG